MGCTNLLHHVLRPHAAYAAAYLDYVIIHSNSWAEHMQWVATVLELLTGWAHRQPIEVCSWTEGGMVSGVPLGYPSVGRHFSTHLTLSLLSCTLMLQAGGWGTFCPSRYRASTTQCCTSARSWPSTCLGTAQWKKSVWLSSGWLRLCSITCWGASSPSVWTMLPSSGGSTA